MRALLERDEALAVAATAAAAARAGAGPRLVAVEAQAGLGKTALLAAAAERSEVPVHAARAEEDALAWPFGVVVAALAPAVLARPQALAGTAAAAAPLFPGLAPAPEPAAAPAPDALPARAHALAALAAELAADAPLVLVVDDLHWADAPSLTVLERLARDGPPGVGLLVASRPAAGAAPARLERLLAAAHAHVTLAPLSARAVAELVRRQVPGAADDVCARVGELTAGNPLLVDELARRAREQGGALDGLAPDAARRIVARTSAAGSPARALAEALAVLGADATPARAAALAGLDDAAATAELDHLTAAGLAVADDAGARLAHPLVRAALTDALGPVRRGALEGAAAALLHREGAAPPRVAAHLLGAPPAAHAWAVAALREAAGAALAAGDPDGAVRLLERALAEPPPPDPPPSPRARVLLELGTARTAAGVDGPAGAAFREALALLVAPADRCRALLGLARAHLAAGRFADAQQAATDGMRALGDLDTPEARALRAECRAAAMYGMPGDDLAVLADDLRPPTNRAERALLAQTALHGTVGLTLGADRALELTRWALDDGRLVAEEPADEPVLGLCTGVLFTAGRYEEDVALCDAALATARRRGAPRAFAVAAYLRSIALLLSGRPVDAAADAEHVLAVLEPGSQWRPGGETVLALALGELDDLERAVAVLAGARPPAQPSVAWPVQLAARARVRLLAGEPEGAVADARAALAASPPVFANPATLLHPRAAAARALASVGRRDEAVAVAAEELDAARRWGAPTTIGTSLAALGFAQGGPEGLATLAEAAELLAGTEGRLAHVEALVDLGAALRRAGRRADARAVLADAHGRAVALGLPRLARLADAELAATGARARSVLRSGADALTPSERRVADLAAAGRTNREIAALLFVSQKTVEFHLRNAFRTLGVRSRDALAEALRR